jgi:hypothetical protein
MVNIDKSYSIINPIHWIEESNIVLANGDTYSFDKRPYLMAMFMSKARLKCIRKARGLGFSETEILGSIHGLYSGRYRQGVQYVFPTDTDMRKFCQSRFNIVINRNRCLKDLVIDTNTTNYKRIGEGNLFLDGGGCNRMIEGLQAESMTFRGTQVDKAVLDELDMFDDANSVVESALTSMKNSEVKEVTALSNPSIPNYAIDGLFQISNQNFWYRLCQCGELTCPDKEFPDLIDKQGCHCKKCGGLLMWKGIWKPDYPNRNNLYGVRSTDWEGYHISDLNAPHEDPYSVVEKFKDKSDMNLEKLYKFTLGLPFMPRTNALTLAEVFNCCGYQPEYENYPDQTIMGVDVGSSSGFHVVIGLRIGKDEYQVLRVDRLQGFEDVTLLGHRFHVKNCVCDMLPETTAARKFQKEAGFRVWLNLYNTTNPVDEITWNQDDRTVKTYRNYIFDNSQRVVGDKRVKLPRRSSKIEEFAKQYIVPVKIQDKTKTTNVFKYFSPSTMDHYRNAMNYFLIASLISRITKPYGSAQQKNQFVVNDTQRYI